MSPAARRLAGAASAAPVLLPLAVFCLGLAYLTGPDPFNSDNLYANAFCADVLAGADLGGWNFPGAPDLLLLLPCQWLAPDLVWAYFAYDGLFYGTLLAALFWLGRQVGLGRRDALTAAAAGLLFLLAVHLRDAYRGVGRLMGHPGNHVGGVLVGVLLLALLARALRRGHGRAGAAAFVLAGALGSLSDKLLVVQFLLPACLALGALWLARRVTLPGLLRHAALVVTALLLGEGVKLLLTQAGWRFEAAGEDFRRTRPGDLAALGRGLWEFVHDQHLLLAVAPLAALAAVLVLWAGRRAARRGEADAAASGGRARQAPAGLRGFLTFGPYLSLPPGRYFVDFLLRVDDNSSAGPVAEVSVCRNETCDALAARTLRASDFPAAGAYATFRLTFDAAEGLDVVQFRVAALGGAALRADYVELTRCPPAPRPGSGRHSLARSQAESLP